MHHSLVTSRSRPHTLGAIQRGTLMAAVIACVGAPLGAQTPAAPPAAPAAPTTPPAAAPAAPTTPPAAAPAKDPQSPPPPAPSSNPDYRLVSAPAAVVPQPVAPASLSATGGRTPPGVVPLGVPYLPPTTETMVLNAPTPTVSPTWGLRVAMVDGQILVTGPERAPIGGNHGQLANWMRDGAQWKGNLKMAEVIDLGRNDIVFQRNAYGRGLFATTLERRAGGSMIALLEPKGDEWVQTAQLGVTGPMARDGFGSALATDGSNIVVASVDLRVGPEKGARSTAPELFIYSRQPGTWSLDGFLTVPQTDPARPREAMWFGSALAVDVGTLAVGSPATIMPRPTEETPISGQATVFILRKAGQNWLPEAEIKGIDVTPWPCFGVQVALEGDLLAVRGFDPTNALLPSKVWLYKRTGTDWKLQSELVPVDACLPGRAYGNRMTISKGRVIISDTNAKGLDEQMGPTPGMVFVFEEKNGAWVNTYRLMPSAPCAPAAFGQDVAAEWPWVIVARPRNETLGLDPGGAYVFKLE